MKFSWMNTLLLVITAAALGFAFTRGTTGATTPTMARLQDAGWLAQQLNLTPEQAAAIDKLQSDFGDTLSECCGRHCTARLELGEQFFASDFSPEKEKELVEVMVHAQADSDVATLSHIKKVHSLLNDEQKKKYEDLVTQCLCADCTTCGAHTTSTAQLRHTG